MVRTHWPGFLGPPPERRTCEGRMARISVLTVGRWESGKRVRRVGCVPMLKCVNGDLKSAIRQITLAPDK